MTGGTHNLARLRITAQDDSSRPMALAACKQSLEVWLDILDHHSYDITDYCQFHRCGWRPYQTISNIRRTTYTSKSQCMRLARTPARGAFVSCTHYTRATCWTYTRRVYIMLAPYSFLRSPFSPLSFSTLPNFLGGGHDPGTTSGMDTESIEDDSESHRQSGKKLHLMCVILLPLRVSAH